MREVDVEKEGGGIGRQSGRREVVEVVCKK
jgi:hypothetical protein